MTLQNPWFIAAIVGLVGWFHVKLLAEILNLSRLQRTVPEPMRDLVTEADQERAMEYHVATAKLDVLRDAFMLGLFIGFWLVGGFQWVDAWAMSFSLSPIPTGLILISALAIAQTLLSLPFGIWSTFKVEAAFGFNKTTIATFIADLLKSLALSAILGLPLLALVLWLFERLPSAALWAWVVTSVFGLLMSWLAPRLIMPLFMKFTPMADSPLRRAIMALAEKLHFPVSDISVVDGSRRSTKANAFFAGFGKTKRIALFDTLLTGHDEDEIVGVLAHEIGHSKLKHVPQQIAVGLAQSALMFGLLHFALHDARLFSAFGVMYPSGAMGLVLFMIVYGPWSHLLDAPLQWLTRKHEFEADRFAAQSQGSPAPLMTALKKLSRDHLAHLTPHPFYVKLHYSHPPLLERLKALAQTPLLVALALLTLMTTAATAQLSYPTTRQGDVIDDYHGTKVPDPYRWLEDDNAPETKAWVAAQNKVTFGYLEAIPSRAKFRERLQKLWNYERFGIPTEHGGRYFFSRNSGLQNQSVLYVADSLDATPRELLDPNKLSKDGTISLSTMTPSEDGKHLAYGLSKAGSDWVDFRVRNVDTGKDEPDELTWIKFSGASWAKDGSGFYYGRFPQPKEGAALTQKNENKKLYFHKLGDKQDADTLVYERPDHPDWGISGNVTDDGRYLIITITVGTDPKNRVFYKDLSKPDAAVVELLNDFDADYNFIDNDGPVFFFTTDLDAPRYRVIAIDTTKPDRKAWRTLIPEAKDKLEGVSLVGGQFLCEYLHDARSLVLAHDLEGKLLHEIELPGIGTAGGFGGRRSDKETFYAFSGYTSPGVIYRYDIASGKSTVYRQPKIDFDSSPYETKQVFVTSKDGTRVPMFITHRKGLQLDASTPCLLYGYGGFNISLTPSFSVGRAVWLEQGGIYAVANLRGGGEYGADWHKAGIKLKKQNVFDDFIACAEWLIKERYTQPAKLAIQGGSNGGLLVGACMTQRPELFGAALPAVGVMDMLRFHQFTIGWAWKSDYGSSEDVKEFAALHAYSPLHQLKPGTRYPATLVATSDHDDRVVPAHSFKFAATLQACQSNDGPPVLIRIETSAGHGAGTALNKMIETTADEWAFLVKALGME